MKEENHSTGWTEDMHIKLIGTLDFESLIDQILSRFRNYEDFSQIYEELIVPNVAEEDRDLVLDRAIGGIVRALTGNQLNKPDKIQDPIAYKTFVVVWNSFKIRFFGSAWVGGFWKTWNEWRLKKYKIQ